MRQTPGSAITLATKYASINALAGKYFYRILYIASSRDNG